MQKITKNTEFVYKNIGYGYTTFEEGNDFDRIRNGKLYTDTFSSSGMEWDGKQWIFDGGLGLKTYLVLKKDLTEEELKNLASGGD